MAEDHDFAREDVFPSWFANRIQDFISGCLTTLRISLLDSDTIRVVPDSELGIAAIAIQGRWRFITSTITRDFPGGVGGTYHVWAVATDNDITEAPKPHSDHTDYSFDLRITAAGVPPSGSGVVIYEKIGEIFWSGTAITSFAQTHGQIEGAQIASGALDSSSSSDITWTRVPGGGWAAQHKTDSVGANEIVAEGVGTAELAALAVTVAKLAAEAVTNPKLADLSINEQKIQEKAIGAARLGEVAVLTIKIAELAVTTPKIANLAVTAGKLAEEAVETLKLKNLAVTTAKLAELAITTAKLANEAVTAAKIAPNAVTGPKIIAGAVEEKLGLIRGRVSAAGALVSGSGFTVAKIEAGHYLIKFTAEYAVVPVCQITPEAIATFGRFASNMETEAPKKELRVRTFDQAGTSVDSAFAFAAMLPA